MTLKVDSGTGAWIGFQILFGAGIGMSLEQCNIAIQAVLPDDKLPVGISLAILTRSLGGAIAIAIGQNVFERKLSLLNGVVPASVISESGATDLIANVESVLGDNPTAIHKVLALYNNALTRTFLVSLITAAMTLPFAFVIEWKSVKKENREREDEKEKGKRKTRASPEGQMSA